LHCLPIITFHVQYSTPHATMIMGIDVAQVNNICQCRTLCFLSFRMDGALIGILFLWLIELEEAIVAPYPSFSCLSAHRPQLYRLYLGVGLHGDTKKQQQRHESNENDAKNARHHGVKR